MCIKSPGQTSWSRLLAEVWVWIPMGWQVVSLFQDLISYGRFTGATLYVPCLDWGLINYIHFPFSFSIFFLSRVIFSMVVSTQVSLKNGRIGTGFFFNGHGLSHALRLNTCTCQISPKNWSSRHNLVNSSLSLATILGHHATEKKTVTTCLKLLWRLTSAEWTKLWRDISKWRDVFVTRWLQFLNTCTFPIFISQKVVVPSQIIRS